jgi:hypothetical protein
MWSGRGRHSRIEQPLWGPAYLFLPAQEQSSSFTSFRASLDAYQPGLISADGLYPSCKGFIIDQISGLAASEPGYFYWNFDSAIAPQNSRSAYGDFKSTSEALLRTLLHDRVDLGQRSEPRQDALLHLPSTFRNALPEFVQRGWRWLAGQEGYYLRRERFREAVDDFPLGGWQFKDFFDDEIPAGASEYDTWAAHLTTWKDT